MRAAIYARVSTPRQAHTQKIDQQLEQLKGYAERKGWTLEQEHVYLVHDQAALSGMDRCS
jgi:site-specific DNA recombinase